MAENIEQSTPMTPGIAAADQQPAVPAPFQRPRFEAPWVILAALLVATILAAHQSNLRTKKDAQARFGDMAVNASKQILNEVRHVEDAMALGGAVIASSPNIDNKRWNTYLDARIQRAEPAIGLVRLEYRAAAKTRNAGKPAERPLLIRDLEEELRLGDFLSTSPLIDDAVVVARRTQKSVMTTALLGHDAFTATEYVAMVKPVYASFVRSDEPVGYMVAILRPHKLLAFAATENGQRLALAIMSRNDLLSISAGRAAPMSALSVQLPLSVGQREWTLDVGATTKLVDELSSQMPATILFVGILGTLSLAGLMWLLTRLREQAATLANSMTLKLRDQVKFTDDLIELNPNPIYRKDAEGRLISVNRAWEQLNKRDRKDVIGKTSHAFQAARIADAETRFDADVLASPAGFEAREAYVVDAAGKEVPTIMARQVVRRADGTVDGIIGTITDVTPVKQLEREVARQREQLDLVIRSSQQGIFDVDFAADGNQYYSERFREILGFGPDNFPAKFTWKDWVYPADDEMFHAHLLEHLKRLSAYFDVECRARRVGAGHMWLRVRGVAQYDDHDVAIRFVGSIVDVTERREAEMKLIEANIRVMEAARAKEAFLATMSHEIRTPMNGVLGMASLLADTELNDEQRDYIRLIRSSGDTLLRLINDVLDFSKIESGQMTLESVTVELVSVIEEAFELVAEKAREKNLALVYDLRDDIPDYIIADATRLRQILLNLLSNAIKFTDKGEIALTMSCEEMADGKLKLTAKIHDTGIGIPADRITQLFQPFTQVDASTTRKYGGTGLGLAIVKRLVVMMGGDVSLTSVEGSGSTFSFSIVTSATKGPPRPYLQRAIPAFAGVRLLLVDGNLRRRDAVAHRYQLWGFTVMPETCAEAIGRLQVEVSLDHPVDILVTDTLLPSTDADALAAVVAMEDRRRTAAGLPKLSVVLMSNLSRADLARLKAFKPLRHDMLVVRPASRSRMFDVLTQAAMRINNNDVATRPFTPVPVYDGEFSPGARATSAVATKSESMPVRPAVEANAVVVDPINILVAEDNEVNQRVIEGMLKRLGHHVTIVADGQAAVDKMAAQKPDAEDLFDVVLMDIHMPVLDGVAAMKAIKQLFDQSDLSARLKTIPIAAMTAHALAGDREHYLGEGMDDYIAKPIRREDLAALLQRTVPQKRHAAGRQAPPAGTMPASGKAGATGPTEIAARRNQVPTPTPEDTLPLLDLEQLEDLRGLPAGPAEVPGSGANGLIDLFKQKSRERLRVIASCLVDANWVLLGDTAHSMRGAAASVGFPRVAAACKSMELAARRLSPVSGIAPVAPTTPMPTRAQLDAQYEQVTRHFYEAEAALQQWLDAGA